MDERGVGDAEHRRRCADADGDAQCRGQCGTKLTSENPRSEHPVLAEGAEELEPTFALCKSGIDVDARLASALQIPEAFVCESLGFVARMPLRQVLRESHLIVKAQFVIDVATDIGAPKAEVPPPTRWPSSWQGNHVRLTCSIDRLWVLSAGLAIECQGEVNRVPRLPREILATPAIANLIAGIGGGYADRARCERTPSQPRRRTVPNSAERIAQR